MKIKNLKNLEKSFKSLCSVFLMGSFISLLAPVLIAISFQISGFPMKNEVLAETWNPLIVGMLLVSIMLWFSRIVIVKIIEFIGNGHGLS